MFRKLIIVNEIRKEEMRQYFYEYLKELSEFDPSIEFKKDGTPIYKWFDVYFLNKDRFPIYLMIDEKIAGFAMIREMGPLHYDFAEFYVSKDYRKDGNAIFFAKEITELFEGKFEFATRFSNPRAIKFWQKFALLFEDNVYYDDLTWRNWVIRKN